MFIDTGAQRNIAHFYCGLLSDDYDNCSASSHIVAMNIAHTAGEEYKMDGMKVGGVGSQTSAISVYISSATV